ncbi:MAG TPA: NAD(P)/FAD-dependent oxidoreductase [Candidatus Saccharimonadales bacterium]
MTEKTQTHVLIVGGGFAGVKTALELSKDKNVQVTLLSDRPDFRYYPALYHTATGGKRAQSSIPLPQILGERGVNIERGEAKTLDRATKTVTTADGRSFSYDILVLALGVMTNYFGINGLEEFSYGIKSWEQIQKFKKHIHEEIGNGQNPELNYVIVGAGPTGIELAGALPEYLQQVMEQHGVAAAKPHIEIIEAAPRLLPHSSEKTSAAVAKRLQKLGIELKLGQTVEGQTADHLMVSGQPIASRTVVWTAGTSNSPFFKANDFALNEHGKVVVDSSLRSEETIYVLGDNAATPFSGLAQIAVRDGEFAAEDIQRRLKGKTPKTYAPAAPITVIPVGPHWAAVDWKDKSFVGLIGWWLRSAADWIAFKDLEPWWKATKQWMNEYGADVEEDCPICSRIK